MSKYPFVSLAKIVGELENGSRPEGGVDSSGDVFSIGGEHLNDFGSFDFSSVKLISNDFYNKMKRGKVKPQDIIIVKDGATTGKTSFVTEQFPHFPCAINEHVFRLAVNQKIADPKYVFYYLYSPKGNKEILDDFRGATVGGISQNFVNKVFLPLPPLAEQKRIASLLGRADRLRQLRRAANALADSLLQSVFLEMFGEPQVNDKKWDVESIGDCVEPTKQVNPKSLGSSKFWYVDITSIDRERKIIVEPKLLQVEDAPSRARKHIIFNDVLVSTVRPNLNAVARVPQYLDNQIASTGFCVLRPDIKKLSTEYLFAIVQSKYFINHLVKNETGANYPAVSDGIILDTPIPLPPLALQEEFGRIVGAERRSARTGVESLRARMAEAERQAQNLFESLLAQSFGG
jgi:type I restriction enzyme S subunit